MSQRPPHPAGTWRAGEPVGEGVPPTLAQRQRLLRAARDRAAGTEVAPPLSLDELTAQTDRMLADAGLDGRYRRYATVLLNNELWRETVAAVPFDRRLLLLPQCLRHADECPAGGDELGLLCAGCGRCVIGDLQQRAQRLGYSVLVSEGTAVVTELVSSGQIDAVIGTSCLSVLEKVYPYLESGALPGIAIPLLRDGCRGTALDLDWLVEAVELTVADRTRGVEIEPLRERVRAWFAPPALDELLGQSDDPTERLARDWLARAGKRWRPLLAVAAHQALQEEPSGPLRPDLRRAGVAVECFHKASLIHDDIEDGDRTRYGRPTLHAAHGVPVALNVGDLLLGEGYRLLAETDAPAEARAAMLATAAAGHRQLCLGQGAELSWRARRRPLAVAEVLDIFRLKTAPAFRVALEVGAALAGAEEAAREVLARCSAAVGTAYQIRDDLDDFAEGADPADAEAQRPSILLAVAWERAAGRQRELIERAWLAEADEAGRLSAVLEAVGARQAATELMAGYRFEALRTLHELDSPGLRGLLRRVIARILPPVAVETGEGKAAAGGQSSA
jgi:geranylgeranyl pyrophosphate synthase